MTRGDFGHSLYYNKPVADVVGERLPRTLALALVCHILASVIGIAFGIFAATRQYSWVDSLLSGISFLGMTVPRFLMALIIVYILVFHFNVSEINSFHSARYGGAPWSWDKFVDLVKHVWPVIAIATFGGLAYNMRVMRGNLLDTLNAQYVETARAKGLSEGAVIMRHAVPNALHPLVMYQGVVLPYMLTGEIETAIIFALPTVGPAIVGSMWVGDVYVTATFMLVLSATLIVGNIIADMLLGAARSACSHRCGGQLTMSLTTEQIASRQQRIIDRSKRLPNPRGLQPSASAHSHESYLALVWRRLRRSWTGMIGLVLVMRCCCSWRCLPTSSLRWIRRPTDIGFAPPQTISFIDQRRQFRLGRAAIRSARRTNSIPSPSSRSSGRTMTIRNMLGFFVKGAPYRLLGLIPPTGTSSARSTARPSICSAPTSSAATCCRASSMARASR